VKLVICPKDPSEGLTQVLNTASLYRAGVSSRPVGVWLVAVHFGDNTIITRVAVDDGSYHTKLLSSLDLETSEDCTISHESDLALQLDTRSKQILEVDKSAVVAVDVLRSDITTSGIAMESRHAIFRTGCRIFFENVLLESCLEGDFTILQQSKSVVQRIVDIDFVWHDLALDTKLFPSVLCPDGLAEILSSKMRPSRVVLGPLLGLLRVGCG
jgi:hypothetical protein